MAKTKATTTPDRCASRLVLSDSEAPLTLVRDLLSLQKDTLSDRLSLALNEKAAQELDFVLAEIHRATQRAGKLRYPTALEFGLPDPGAADVEAVDQITDDRERVLYVRGEDRLAAAIAGIAIPEAVPHVLRTDAPETSRVHLGADAISDGGLAVWHRATPKVRAERTPPARVFTMKAEVRQPRA